MQTLHALDEKIHLHYNRISKVNQLVDLVKGNPLYSDPSSLPEQQQRDSAAHVAKAIAAYEQAKSSTAVAVEHFQAHLDALKNQINSDEEIPEEVIEAANEMEVAIDKSFFALEPFESLLLGFLNTIRELQGLPPMA